MRHKTWRALFLSLSLFFAWSLGPRRALSRRPLFFFFVPWPTAFFLSYIVNALLLWVCLCVQAVCCTSQCLEGDIEPPYRGAWRSLRQNATRMPRHDAGACHGAAGVSHAAAARARAPCSQGRSWSRAPWPLPHRHARGGSAAHAQRRCALWRRRVAHVDVHHLAGAHNGSHNLPPFSPAHLSFRLHCY